MGSTGGLSYINNASGQDPGCRDLRGQQAVRKWRAQGRPEKLGREGEGDENSEVQGAGVFVRRWQVGLGRDRSSWSLGFLIGTGSFPSS